MVTEPLLLPTAGVKLPPGSNTADNARADISARSIWNPLKRAFLDVRVYHAQAPFNRNLKIIPRMYSHHEELEVERGVFTPLVFSTSGGMREEPKTLFKRVAAKMANKTGRMYSEKYLRQEKTALRPSENNGHRNAECGAIGIVLVRQPRSQNLYFSQMGQNISQRGHAFSLLTRRLALCADHLYRTTP